MPINSFTTTHPSSLYVSMYIDTTPSHDPRSLVEKNILQNYSSTKYNVMYYKNDGRIGIRRKGGKSAFSFGGRSGLGEEKLRSWADEVLKELDKGRTEEAVKTWIEESLAA